MTTKSTITWKRIGTLALSLTLAWGLGPVYAQSGVSAAAVSSTCGSGDHGLSATLKKGSGVEDYLSGGSPAAGKVGIGRSYDAGSTWKNIDLKGPGYSSRISFPSAQTGWLVVTSDNSPAIYQTTDGGTSWAQKMLLPSERD